MHIEFKNLCNASKHMNMHISNVINQSSWAWSPYLCASLVQEFWSISFLQCCSLFVHVHVQPLLFYLNLSQSFHILSYLSCTILISRLSYLCTISPPLSSISIKGVLLIDAKACFWIDGWGLYLAFFMDITWLLEWHHLKIPLLTCTTCILCRAFWDTTHRIFDLDINLCDTSPYVQACVILLIILSSCVLGMYSSLEDHSKLRITCGTNILYEWYHV